jgi:hypothetical protein
LDLPRWFQPIGLLACFRAYIWQDNLLGLGNASEGLQSCTTLSPP